MKKTNKKQIPKVRLPKYSPGGSHKFNESMYDSSQSTSTQGTKDAYNEKRSKSSGLGNASNYAIAAANTAGNYVNVANDPNLNSAQRTTAYTNAANQTADAVLGAVPVYGQLFGAAKGVSDMALSAGTKSNIDPNTGEKAYQGKFGSTAAVLATPTHTNQITAWGKLLGGDTSAKNLLSSFTDPTVVGAIDAMTTKKDKYGDNQKAIDAKNKEAEAAYNQQQIAAQQQQQSMMDASFERGMANYNQNNPQGGANNTIQYAKYGGQMKFAMGGMQYANGGTGQINSEVEGGGYNQDGENAVAPNGEFTQFNGPTHAQGGIQTDMAPGTRIFSAKLNPVGSKKSFAKLNESNNTNREDKLEAKGNLDPKSKTSIDLTRMAKMKNSDMLFAMQEQLKKDKVAAYAKKMGVELPSMDNESMEQGQSEQSEGEYKYGGIHINPVNKGKFTASAQRAGMGTQEFASHVLANKEDYSSTQVKRANFAHNAAGWKHEMGGMQQYALGGVQLPYYNTDRNGNPKYTMGGFNDGDPLTSVNTSTITNAKKVDTIPANYAKIGTQGSRTYYDLPSDKAKVNPAGGKVSSDWENSIIKRLEGGTSAKSLADAGHISHSQIDKYNKYYKPLYTEIQPTNTFTQPSTTLPINQKIALKDENRIDRKSVFTGAPYNTFQYPDVNAGYSKATTRYFDPKTNQEIDASKSFDPKGNYVPSYLNNPVGGVEGTLKETRYNTPIGSTTDNPVLKSGTKSAGTTGFKYGGKMPKYVLGGKEDGDNELGYTPKNPAEAYRMQQAAKMNNARYSQKSSYSPNVLPWEKTNDSENTPNNPYVNSKVNPYNNIDAADRKAEREAREAAEIAKKGPPPPPMNNIDKFGNLFNFIGQNAGNIYDLTRKNEPLQKYERAKASYLDNTAAMRDAEQEARRDEYAVRGASGGNAGTYLANRVGLNTAKVMNKDRIRQQYANANAQIGNQNAQFNAEIAYREAEARAKDAAMKENVRSQAIASLGSSFGKATKSGKQDNIDQDTLKMFQWRYKNEPGFKKYIDNFST
jgi:hypothetical protein